MGVPVYILFMKVIYWGGEYFYFYLFGTYIVVLLIFMHIVPNWIMPLFNKYAELEKPELKSAIE